MGTTAKEAIVDEVKPTYAMVRDVLEHCGPMTAHEVARFLGIKDYHAVSSILSALRVRVAKQQVYIQSYSYDGVGRYYPRAVYALGAKRDAKKPLPQDNIVRCRRYKAMKKSRVINSVWSLANEMPTLRVNNQSKGIGVKAT